MKIIKDLPRPAKKGELVSLDLEIFQQDVTKLHRPGGHFACLSIGYLDGTVYVVQDQKDVPAALERIQNGHFCIQNSLYDLRQLRRWAKIKPRPIYDRRVVEQGLLGVWYSRFELANLPRRWLREKLPKGVREQFGGTQTMTPEMIEYAASDAWATVRIAEKQMEYVEEEEDGKFNWYHDIDEQMIWVVLDMPGVRIDVDAWRAQNIVHQREADRLEKELDINVMSREQVVDLLMGLGARHFKKTDKGNDSTSHEALEKIREDASLSGNEGLAGAAGHILSARLYSKAVRTYGDKWLDTNVEADGYVYPAWRITGAETGRMSCSDPNLQQVPMRELPIFRSFFLARPNHRLLIADVNMQEPRWTAWLSGDTVLQDEIKADTDLHRVAAALFRLKGTRAARRRKGKDINLGLNYGMSAKGLAARVGISLQEAETGLRARPMHYRGGNAWQTRMQRQAERLHKVRTASGRPVWVNPYDYQWMRNAINGPVQGSAADQTKLAAVIVTREFGAPTLIIHDEMCLNVASGDMRKARRAMDTAWQEAGRVLLPDMPVKTEMKSGLKWSVKS